MGDVQKYRWLPFGSVCFCFQGNFYVLTFSHRGMKSEVGGLFKILPLLFWGLSKLLATFLKNSLFKKFFILPGMSSICVKLVHVNAT